MLASLAKNIDSWFKAIEKQHNSGAVKQKLLDAYLDKVKNYNEVIEDGLSGSTSQFLE